MWLKGREVDGLEVEDKERASGRMVVDIVRWKDRRERAMWEV